MAVRCLEDMGSGGQLQSGRVGPAQGDLQTIAGQGGGRRATHAEPDRLPVDAQQIALARGRDRRRWGRVDDTGYAQFGNADG